MTYQITCSMCGSVWFQREPYGSKCPECKSDGGLRVLPTGTKFDQGKPRWELLPLDTVGEVVKVLTYGAAKYEDHNWKLVERDRYLGALMRHLTAHESGELKDKESGLLHLAHVACNALFLLHEAISHADLPKEEP